MNASSERAQPDAGAEQSYQQKLASGRFEIQCCHDCRQHFYYPRVLCPHCGSKAVEWVAPSGRGTVYATTVVRRKPEQGGDYNVAVIELEEGPRMMSRVDGVAPGQVRIDMRVSVRIVECDGRPLVVFVPEHARGAA